MMSGSDIERLRHNYEVQRRFASGLNSQLEGLVEQAAALQGIIETALHVCGVPSETSSAAVKRGYSHNGRQWCIAAAVDAAPHYNKRVRRAAGQHTDDYGCQSSPSDVACVTDSIWQAGSPIGPAHEQHDGALPIVSLAPSSTSPWVGYKSNDVGQQPACRAKPQLQTLQLDKPLVVLRHRQNTTSANGRHTAHAPASPHTPPGGPSVSRAASCRDSGHNSQELPSGAGCGPLQAASPYSSPAANAGAAATPCQPRAIAQRGWPAWPAATCSSPAQVLGFPKPSRLSDHDTDGGAFGSWSLQGGPDPVSPPSRVPTPPAACHPVVFPLFDAGGGGAADAAVVDHTGGFVPSAWVPGDDWCFGPMDTPQLTEPHASAPVHLLPAGPSQ